MIKVKRESKETKGKQLGEDNCVTISVSKSVYTKLKINIKRTKFQSVSEYVEYIINSFFDKSDEQSLTKEEEDKIKNSLKSLGYL